MPNHILYKNDDDPGTLNFDAHLDNIRIQYNASFHDSINVSP